MGGKQGWGELEMKNIIPVVAACVTDEGSFCGISMLLHRKDETRNPELVGKYEFPGGMMEYEETPEMALRREIREELNEEIIIGRLLYAKTFIAKNNDHFLVLYYHCKLTHRQSEIKGCVWVSGDTIADLKCSIEKLGSVQSWCLRGKERIIPLKRWFRGIRKCLLILNPSRLESAGASLPYSSHSYCFSLRVVVC